LHWTFATANQIELWKMLQPLSTRPEAEYFLPWWPSRRTVTGTNTVLHLQEGIAMIGIDILVIPTFWLYK
jgi:hypothetical protein